MTGEGGMTTTVTSLWDTSAKDVSTVCLSFNQTMNQLNEQPGIKQIDHRVNQ